MLIFQNANNIYKYTLYAIVIYINLHIFKLKIMDNYNI